MDLKRIATIIGVALISYFGFYITVFVYNFIAILYTTPENQYRVLAIFTAIIVTTIENLPLIHLAHKSEILLESCQ